MKKELLTKTELKQRKWNDRLIESLLGEPDEEKRNPHYRNAPPVKLYSIKRVLRKEKTKKFQAHLSKRDDRETATKKAVETKKRKTAEFIDSIKIELPAFSPSRLLELAKENYNSGDDVFSGRKEQLFSLPDWSETDAFRDRIAVNFLRHCATDYDCYLDQLVGLVGKDSAYLILFKKIIDEIAVKYPFLADEANRQFNRKNNFS